MVPPNATVQWSILQFSSNQTHSFFARKLKVVQSALHGLIFYFHPTYPCIKYLVKWWNRHFTILKVFLFPFLSWTHNKKIRPCSALLTTFIFILTLLRDWSLKNYGMKTKPTNCPDSEDNSLISPNRFNIFWSLKFRPEILIRRSFPENFRSIRRKGEIITF